MTDEAMTFRIQAAIMQQFGKYWSPAGWMTRAEWQQFNTPLDDQGLDLGEDDEIVMKDWREGSEGEGDRAQSDSQSVSPSSLRSSSHV